MSSIFVSVGNTTASSAVRRAARRPRLHAGSRREVLECHDHLVLVHDVRVLRPEVEEVGPVRPLVASPTASSTTIGSKPFCMASTPVARTQPFVVTPVSTTESMPLAVSVAPRRVRRKRWRSSWGGPARRALAPGRRPAARRGRSSRRPRARGPCGRRCRRRADPARTRPREDARDAGGPRRLEHSTGRRQRVLDAGVQRRGPCRGRPWRSRSPAGPACARTRGRWNPAPL